MPSRVKGDQIKAKVKIKYCEVNSRQKSKDYSLKNKHKQAVILLGRKRHLSTKWPKVKQ